MPAVVRDDEKADVITPVINPTIALAFRDGKNELCPQSCEMMKRRTRNPPASMARGIASHQENFKLKYMRRQRVAYGISVLSNCHTPGHTAAFWYLATIFFHAGADALLSVAEADSFVIIFCL